MCVRICGTVHYAFKFKFIDDVKVMKHATSKQKAAQAQTNPPLFITNRFCSKRDGIVNTDIECAIVCMENMK